jgi:hypothetical protein
LSQGLSLQQGAIVDGRYEILRQLGKSGDSCVYEAYDPESGGRLALKLISTTPATHHALRQRLQAELPRLAALQHPGIVRLQRIFAWESCIGIARELVSGSNLETRVADTGGLPAEQAAAVALDLAGALCEAHTHGVLHRDVKPRNVLIDAEGCAHLTDFEATNRRDGMLPQLGDAPVATVAFLPPEVIAGRGADERSDLHALGMTLYFALVGRVPPSPTPQLPPPPRAAGYRPREQRPEIPLWLDDVIARATSAQPEDRFETAEQLIEALQARASNRPGSADPHLLHVCVLCREPGTLGRAVCVHCEDTPDARDDTLVVLERAASRTERAERCQILAALTDDAAGAPRIRRASIGDLPIVRVSRSHARRVAQRLAARGLPARLIPADESWSAIPRAALYAGGLIGLAGLIAGLAGYPIALGSLLALAIAGLPIASYWVRGAALFPRHAKPRTAPALVARVSEVMPQLGTGEARRLLVDALRLGRDLQCRLVPQRPVPDTLQPLNETLIAACTAARQLASIDPVLDALELHGEHSDEPPAGWLESRSLYENARSCVVQSLLDTTALLSELRAQEILDPDQAREALVVRAVELRDDASIAAQLSKEALGIFSSAG